MTNIVNILRGLHREGSPWSRGSVTGL